MTLSPNVDRHATKSEETLNFRAWRKLLPKYLSVNPPHLLGLQGERLRRVSLESFGHHQNWPRNHTLSQRTQSVPLQPENWHARHTWKAVIRAKTFYLLYIQNALIFLKSFCQCHETEIILEVKRLKIFMHVKGFNANDLGKKTMWIIFKLERLFPSFLNEMCSPARFQTLSLGQCLQPQPWFAP